MNYKNGKQKTSRVAGEAAKMLVSGAYANKVFEDKRYKRNKHSKRERESWFY